MSGRRTLVFDADDTLWENNVLFERAIEAYLGWLAHPTLDRGALRAVLDDVERAETAVHGYGSAVFLQSLDRCFERLYERPVTEAERAEIRGLAADLLAGRVELMGGVGETLAGLADRHALHLLTKGEDAEQRRKLDASGLAPYFEGVHVVREKDESTYAELTVRLGLDPASTWMIGNSPKSDILPARRVGWNAVFVPHPATWVLEHAELDPDDPGVVEIARLTDLPGVLG